MKKVLKWLAIGFVGVTVPALFSESPIPEAQDISQYKNAESLDYSRALALGYKKGDLIMFTATVVNRQGAKELIVDMSEGFGLSRKGLISLEFTTPQGHQRGDTVTVKGRYLGATTLTNKLGISKDVPRIIADYLD